MDWLKLFALLVAVASIQTKADGPKKKIRIHLPQKVKHIHHHKKIYITHHPTSPSYAPAYMPSADGAVALPTKVGIPAVANYLPLNSLELIEEEHPRLPTISPAASKLIPLYHARGYYGPTPSEVEEHYDVEPSPEQVDTYLPSGYSLSAEASAPVLNYSPKRVKIIKVNDQPRKKIVRKGKPKRVVVHKRPQTALHPIEELPVTTFHEQFYSDLDSSGTIQKIKKPPRVEKIVDGDTEHIHTYSEEHIHKLVFDDMPKYTNVVEVDPVSSISSLRQRRPTAPYKNSNSVISLPSDSYTNIGAVNSIESPEHIDYSMYSPHEVTHDHIFHDHGELPVDVDISKESLSLPPKVSYNSQGLRLSGGIHERPRQKYRQRTKKNKPTPNDYSYNGDIYSSKKRPKNPQRPIFLDESDININDYKPVKTRNIVPTYYGKPGNEYRPSQSSASVPYSVSSTVIHDYKPQGYSASSSVPKYKDPVANFKDNYVNNYEYDTYASSSNVFASEQQQDNNIYIAPKKQAKKKSVSTQNISFGNQDLQTYVDHLEQSSLSDDNTPTALDNFDQYDQPQVSILPSPTSFTIKESSPVHPYYSVMGVKALVTHNEQLTMPAASNDNYQYAEAPTAAPTIDNTSVNTTTSVPPPPVPIYDNVQDAHLPSVNQDEYLAELRQSKKNRKTNNNLDAANAEVQPRERYVLNGVQPTSEYRLPVNNPEQAHPIDHDNRLTGRAKLKYGDKI